MQNLMPFIISSSLTIIIGLLGFIAKKFVEVIEKINQKADHNDKRDDVQDRIISELIKKHFDSSAIVKNGIWPPNDRQ